LDDKFDEIVGLLWFVAIALCVVEYFREVYPA
jgi:hypothetical protein